MSLYLGPRTFTLQEDQRQVILLAIARLSIERPGWDMMLGELAEILLGKEMYDSFREFKEDEVTEELKLW